MNRHDFDHHNYYERRDARRSHETDAVAGLIGAIILSLPIWIVVALIVWLCAT